jgi:hypothetical protein
VILFELYRAYKWNKFMGKNKIQNENQKAVVHKEQMVSKF